MFGSLFAPYGMGEHGNYCTSEITLMTAAIGKAIKPREPPSQRFSPPLEARLKLDRDGLVQDAGTGGW